jgi:signal transduction histidine kinase
MDELSQIALFQNLPDNELDWLLAHSWVEHLEPGSFFFEEGGPADSFYVTLQGELQVSRELYGQEVVLGTTPRGIIGGEISLLQGTRSQVTARAILPTKLLVLDGQAFREMFAHCPTLAARVFSIAAQRAQGLASNLSQRDLMAALGKLSAGLAHELNNPAAAARRAARELADGLPALQARTMKVSQIGLNDVQLQSLVALQRDAIQNTERARGLSPLQRSEQEDGIADWLDDRQVDDSYDMAAILVSAGVSLDDLEALAGFVTGHQLAPMLSWLCTALHVAGLLDEVEESTRRISALVAAVKGYTYMDQAPMQPVDIHQALENTITIMRSRLRDVALVREYDPDLPLVMGRGVELNQVWTNLIDNAVDAMGGQGTLWLITRCENNFAMVEIADDGPGIPPEVLPRIFEPFFTTKEVGAGTGMGLDITYRIVTQHRGTIEVQRDDGRTRFIVRLPLDE